MNDNGAVITVKNRCQSGRQGHSAAECVKRAVAISIDIEIYEIAVIRMVPISPPNRPLS